MDSAWLARYPRPQQIGFDNGSEFKGLFKQLTINMGLEQKPSLAWNPQSNAILERIHQVLQGCLTAFQLDDKDINEDDPDPFEEYLSSASYAIRCAFHATHSHSPGALVFG